MASELAGPLTGAVSGRSPGWLGGIAAGLAAGALWGLVFVAPHMAQGFAASDLAVGRFLACGLFSLGVMLAPLLRGGRVVWPTPSQALTALGLSVLGYTGYYLVLAWAVVDAGSVLPALIVGTIPVWVMVLGKPHGLSWRALGPGLALTVLGLVIMAHAAEPADLEASGRFWWGLLLATLAMVCWTVFALLNAAWLKRHPQVPSARWATWLGVAAGIGALFLWPVLGSSPVAWVARDGWWLFAGLCLFTGIGAAWVASVLWNVASRRLPPSLAGQLIVSETVFGVVYSFLWDGQWPSAVQLLACGLFVLGVVASVRAHR